MATKLQQCPSCRAENDAEQRFCGSCGAPLALVCPTCGTTSRLDFKFCGECGTELRRERGAQALPEERRVVTILFADLVGFTARAERLDPEDVRAILSPYYGRLRSEIESFGGNVEKFIGDAVMAVFGAPLDHGDEPERAVRAALAVRDAVEDMNEADPDLDLQVRIAVNTGEALVALRASAAEGEGMVAGDVVNTAARLQQSAPVNAIVVGEETHRATRNAIEYEETDPVTVKGKREPLRIWKAVAALAQPGERPAIAVPVVGRDRELTFLKQLWDRVVAERRPHIVTIFGPAGVGKTRLATELCGLAARDSGRAIGGRSIPYGRNTAYGAFAQQVKHLCGIFDSDGAEVGLEKINSTLGELLPSAAEETAQHLAMLVGLGESEVPDRQTLFFSARQLVEALGREQPTILLFEDIHWADSGMLDLLELLAARVQDVPVLLLTLARPDLLETRPGWGGGLPAYTALPLEPLAQGDARELAALLLEGNPAYADQLAEASEGNPLFIEELAASLAERATFVGELPSNVRGVISARLDGLPRAERAALLDASVVGRVFWAGALAEMASDGKGLASVLDSLEGRDLIRREAASRIQGEPQFVFKHRLIRDVAYATLPRATRRERHGAVARFLERATADMTDTANALAYHWREAGENERSVHFLLIAAEHAGRGWAKQDAVALYNEALTLVPDQDAERRREISRLQAIAMTALYHLPDAARLSREGNRPE
ncbi:MAG TPA: adenylate/guanylate cyclase domain-containing protein [Gaiellaceae bacterium]|nr:adenylate/guanylate cyclase domain-containing protein [Gaiellaceae bacterium]